YEALGIRLAYTATSVIFGLSHIFSLKETVAFIPEWFPGSPEFWAVSTGIAHLAVSAALVVDRMAVLATRLGVIMYLVFAAIVWVPQCLSKPEQGYVWVCFGLTLILTGALWRVGDYLVA